MTHAWQTYPLAMLLAVCASACEIETRSSFHSAGPYDGTLVVEWTVDDTYDSDACADYDSRYIELVIYDDRDRIVTEEEARCDDFEFAIDLPDGVYGLDATLLDRSGRAVTTTIGLDDIDVYEDDDTVISLDFPIDSQL